MKKYNFSLRALALAVAALFATTSCSDDSSTEEGGGAPASTAALKVVVSDIAGTSATVATTPASASLTYKVGVATEEEFTTYASAEAFAAADLDALKAEALEAGSSLAEYLVSTGLLNSGAKSETVSGLTVSTGYVAFAYGLSLDGEITTEVATAEFTTLESDPEVTFDITATDITATSVKVTVTPSDNATDYYWDLLPSELAESMTEEQLIAALEQMFQSYGTSLYDECFTGADSYTYDDLDPGTEYTIFAFTYTENGEAGKFTTEKITTEDSPIEVLMIAGVYDKTSESFVNTESALTMGFLLTDENNPITSAKLAIFTTEEMNGYLNGSYTYATLLEAAGDDFSASWLTSLNTNKSLSLSLTQGVTPDTEYSLLVQATAQDGKTVILHTEAKTSVVEEASEAYKAWLGDWTVTSAGSLVLTDSGITETNDPISFDITIAAKSNDATYTVTGWGVSADRLELPCTGTFNISKGSFSLVNGSNIQQWADGLEKIYNFSKTSDNKYSLVGGNFDCFTATQAEDGTVTATGYTDNLQGGGSFQVIVCDYFFTISETGQTTYLDFADEYANEDADIFPMLPYTLTKKTASTEPDPTPEAPETPETSRLRKSISVPTFSQFSTISRELKMARPAAMELQAAEAACDAKALKNAASGKQSTDSKKKLAAQLLVK